MIVDSHCHFNMLDLEQVPGGISSILQDAYNFNVNFFLNVATEPKNWGEVLDLAKSHQNIVASIGIHPSDDCGIEPSFEDVINACQNPKVVAIGETGLDYYHTDISHAQQQERFRMQIQAAKQLKKPLIVHTRQAQQDTLNIMKEEGASEVGGVLHCFTESYDMAKAAMEMNFRISFSGIVTFKNAIELKETAKKIPIDYTLIETDAPFLTPVPMRGKPNYPAYVYYIAKYLADLRAEDFDWFCQKTTENFFHIFKDANYALYQEKQHG